MKNFRQAFSETRPTREYSFSLNLAGMLAIGWGSFELPEHQLTSVLGIALIFAALAFEAFVFFSSLFELTWWERRLEARRQEWLAGSRARVDEAIANYEASRCAKAEARRVN